MDETLKHHNPNPVLTANPISKLFFWWLNPLFAKGYVRKLEVDDMYNVCPSDQSEVLGARLEMEWEKEVEKSKTADRKPSLVRSLFRMFGLEYMLLGIVLFLEEGTKVCQPLLLGGLIRYFTPNSTMTKTEGYLYAMGVSLCAIVLAIAHHPYFFGVQRIGMKMRIACCSLLYRKSLRLSNAGLGQTTTGQIVNLMSNDVNRFDQAVIFLHFLWIGPLEAIAVLAILWRELGASTLAGFAVLLLLVPVQGWMGKLFSKFRQKTAKHTDERVKVMNEIIAGMRVIKMYCWEKPFGDLVAKLRSSEVHEVKAAMKLSAVRDCLWYMFGDKILQMVVIIPYLMTKSVSPDQLFTIHACITVLQKFVFGYLSEQLEHQLAALVSGDRIQKFLQLEELDVENDEKSDIIPPDESRIELNNVSAKWDESSELLTLHKVNATVTPGKLLAVIGPVGAGKSSLLMSILKELPLLDGNVIVKGRIAYVAQQPWVFSASFRQNITFGNKFVKSKYDRILKACALNRDVEIMPHGDVTLIGDRGVSLSGGQRARVSLARALYMEADVYLLDDPLSAVDTAVGRHIFENVIQGLLKDKPCVLVTHQLQYLKSAQEILILKEGEMIGAGTFDELSTSGIDFSSLLKRDKEEEEEKPHEPLHNRSVMRLRSRIDSAGSTTSINNAGSVMSLTSIGTEFEAEAVQLPEEEERREGTVGISIYYQYFKAGAGIFKFLLLTVLCIAAQVAYIFSDWWLSYWSNQEEARFVMIQEDQRLLNEGHNSTNITIPVVDTHRNVGIFSAIIFGVFLFGLLRALMFFKVAVDASQKLHNNMFNSILRCPIGFFDTNPVGRVLNRFAKDVGHMDDLLPITFFDFVQCFLLILGIIIVAGVVNPWVFIPVVPLSVLFLIIRRYYLRTSRHIKRLEGTTRSPVFSHLSATLQGLHTIRAFGVQGQFVDEFDNHQNLHTEAWFLFLTSSRWLAIRLDWLCALFVTAVSFCCIFAAENLNAGLVGLSMTYAMTLMGMFQWGVRQSAEVENQMISVERVLDYWKLPSEAPLEVEEKRQPPSDWPQEGVISAERACLRYFEDSPLVLKDLNFCIRGREKIGIVGRTGAGKSSLITMLFRMVEPTGKIMIDDVNIQNIGLHDLRNKISIIPQDPVLFTGALRRNLDPFSEHEDTALWKALEEVELKQAILDLSSGLESEVTEGGSNFSVGQRQLICLARAILRRNKILMIDEATANVDPRTDSLIQQTIREKFKNCTVLTIAHRLNTIMDSHRLLVLDEGRIAEFDAPYILLQNRGSLLYKLVLQTGKAETDHLLEIAEAAYKRHSAVAKNTPANFNQNIEPSSAVSDHDLQPVSRSLDDDKSEEKEDERKVDAKLYNKPGSSPTEETDRLLTDTTQSTSQLPSNSSQADTSIRNLDNGNDNQQEKSGSSSSSSSSSDDEEEERKALLADKPVKALETPVHSNDLDLTSGRDDVKDDTDGHDNSTAASNETTTLLNSSEEKR